MTVAVPATCPECHGTGYMAVGDHPDAARQCDGLGPHEYGPPSDLSRRFSRD